MPKLKSSYMAHGLALEHAMFTPLSFRKTDISYNDRPFASYIILKSFLISTDTLHQQRLSSTASIGVLGLATFGGGMQRNIHKWLQNIEPLGWEHQVKNEAIVNYGLTFEKQLYQSKKIFSLSSIVVLQAGTLMSNVQIGCTVMAGKFNSPLSSIDENSKRKFNIFFYAPPLVRVVGNNATLEGGWINHNSPYTLTPQEVERIVFQSNFGMVVDYHKTFLENSQSILSKEFDKGKSHRYVGFRIGVRF